MSNMMQWHRSQSFSRSRDSREASFTAFSLCCAMVASLTGFMSGYSFAALNGPELNIRECLDLDVLSYDSVLPGCYPVSGGIW
jgi:hypothetical protein